MKKSLITGLITIRVIVVISFLHTVLQCVFGFHVHTLPLLPPF